MPQRRREARRALARVHTCIAIMRALARTSGKHDIDTVWGQNPTKLDPWEYVKVLVPYRLATRDVRY